MNENSDTPQESNLMTNTPYRKFFDEENLKNMDSALLSIYAARVADQNDIRWTTTTPEQFQEALILSAMWHQGQTRANRANLPRTPYIEHPLRNMLRVYRWGIVDSDILIAILLHDTVEDCADKITGYKANDTGISDQRAEALEKLATLFSPEVSYIVETVSNPIARKKPSSQAEKRDAYATHLASVLHNPATFIVKLTDYVDNAGGLYHNYHPDKVEKLTNMYRKYMQVLPVFHTAYRNIETEFTPTQQGNIEIALGKVKKNLAKLDSLLNS